MNDISKIAQVIGVAKKKDGTELRGIGKTGKPWVMYAVILENGVKMNVFGPVSEGDIMFNLVQDDQYHQWKGELKRQGNGTTPASSTQPNMGQPTNAQIMDEIIKLQKIVMGIKDTDKNPMPLEKVNDAMYEEVVLTVDDIDGTEIVDLSEIPF